MKKITAKFYLETQVKLRIAGHYLRDAREWLFIYETLENIPDYIGKSFEAKTFINLRFSFECSLKSSIMSLSKKCESASDAYEMARKHKHNLNKLFNECNSRADKKYRLLSPAFVPNLNKIENLGVGIRYDVDFKTAFKRQSLRELFFNGPISGVVLDGSFRKEFFNETIELYKRASKICHVRFEKHKSSTGEEAGKVEQYIRSKIIK